MSWQRSDAESGEGMGMGMRMRAVKRRGAMGWTYAGQRRGPWPGHVGRGKDMGRGRDTGEVIGE